MSDANEFEIRPIPANRQGRKRGKGYWASAIKRSIELADSGNGVFVPLRGRTLASLQNCVSHERKSNVDLYRGYLIRTRQAVENGKVIGIVIYANRASKEETST